jgi:hypothetical protein
MGERQACGVLVDDPPSAGEATVDWSTPRHAESAAVIINALSSGALARARSIQAR